MNDIWKPAPAPGWNWWRLAEFWQSAVPRWVDDYGRVNDSNTGLPVHYSDVGGLWCPISPPGEGVRLRAERDWLAARLAELHNTKLLRSIGEPDGSNRTPYWKEFARLAVGEEDKSHD